MGRGERRRRGATCTTVLCPLWKPCICPLRKPCTLQTVGEGKSSASAVPRGGLFHRISSPKAATAAKTQQHLNKETVSNRLYSSKLYYGRGLGLLRASDRLRRHIVQHYGPRLWSGGRHLNVGG